MPLTRTDITIISDDNPLKGWLYRPDVSNDPIEAPVIVMAHGFSAVKEMGLDPFARSLAEVGFAVVVFDHPCFGASGGTPRQEVNPERQLRAYRDAITWAQGVAGVDRDRVGVWGTSFSGGHVVVLAAVDDRVSAAVAQVPFLASAVDDIPDELASILLDDDTAVAKGGDPLSIPVVTPGTDGSGALSPDPRAWDFFDRWSALAPSWQNRVTLKSIARLVGYRPLDRATEVRAPVLLIAARDDILAPYELAVRAHESMPNDCELLTVESGHFDVYEMQFDLVGRAAVDWFVRWLDP